MTEGLAVEFNERERQRLFKAVQTRNKKFDGRFYYGVETTGIYCRPICAAKPKLKNIHFFKTQAQAEENGFRPCLRCRPDLSRLSPQWFGTQTTVSRALAYLRDGKLGLDEIALRLGVSMRHLRRLFLEHVGASPIAIQSTLRLHLARQLLRETDMKLIDLGLACGFKSVRRFNSAFLDAYKISPREFRRQVASGTTKAGAVERSDSARLLVLRFPVHHPYAFQAQLTSYRNHAIQGVEHVTDQVYARHFLIDGVQGYFEVRFDESAHHLVVGVEAEDFRILNQVIEGVARLFDLGHSPQALVLPGGCSRRLAAGIRAARIPGSFDPFETAVCIVLGQLVSVAQARSLVAKIVLRFGSSVAVSGGDSVDLDSDFASKFTHHFPQPAQLMSAPLEELGMTRTKAAAIRELARLVAGGDLNLSGFADVEATKEKLLQIKGIGPWTVAMVGLRCLRDPDSIPLKDLIIERVCTSEELDPSEFAPWRSYLAIAIWNLFAGKDVPIRQGAK